MDESTTQPELPSGDALAFKAILDHKPMLFGFIRSRIHNSHLAQDVFQDVVIEIVGAWKNYDSTLPFGTWACCIAKRVCHDVLRRRRQEPILMDDEAIERLGGHVGAITPSALEDYKVALRACVGKLSNDNQQLILLYFGHLPKAEVARIVGKSVAALYVASWRLRAVLSDCVHRTVGTL